MDLISLMDGQSELLKLDNLRRLNNRTVDKGVDWRQRNHKKTVVLEVETGPEGTRVKGDHWNQGQEERLD